MDKNKKNAIVLSIVAVVTLIALVVGATYAYFQNQYGSASNADVNVTTYTTDMLTFETGNAISLYADQTTFGQEKGSLSGETFAKATLVANNKTNEATGSYYVYFNIENNTFKYTLGEDKPELILTVTGPDGNEVTELPGLTHKVVQDRENKSISGFDVTTTNGLITIANKKTITATPSKEEEYKLKLTFVNYEGNQTENTTSGLSAKVMIQKEPIVTTLASYITNLYTGTQGENGIYYHNSSLTNGAGDNSYRFAGASDAVNNYVCFGSTQSPCPADNLYRIIGVFGDKVKLISTKQFNVGGYGERIITMCQRYNGKVCINGGGFYDNGMGSDIPTGYVIQNGKITWASEVADSARDNIIGITKNGKLKLMTNATGNEALEAGIYEGMVFGPFLIVNGKPLEIVGDPWGQAPRVAIGQTKDGIMLFLVVDGENYINGASLQDMVDVLERYGAYNAANLDGGQSSSLVIENKLYNNPPAAAKKQGGRYVVTGWGLIP